MSHHYDDFYHNYPLNRVPLPDIVGDSEEDVSEKKDDKTSNIINDDGKKYNDSECPAC